MAQPKEDAREAPPSLAPIQVDRSNDEEELSSIRGRRGVRVAIAVVVLAAAIGGGAQMLRSMDAKEAYAIAAADLERSETEEGDAFIRCALPNQQHSQLVAPSALRGAIEIATQRMGKTYAKVLTKCTPLLDGFEQKVAGIKAPPDAAPDVRAVSKAANEFGAAWLKLRDSLQRSDSDDGSTAALIDSIVASWQTYQDARTRAKQSLSAKL